MGTAERRKRERNYRADQIRNAAQKIFLERGYDETTIQRIAREAELSIGTIYFYFKTKEEIFASINLKIIEAVDQGLEGIIAQPSTGVEAKLNRAWELLFDVGCRSPLHKRALVHGQLQGSLQNISPPLLEALNDTGRRILNKVARILQEGMDQGVLLPAHPLALADLFWSTFTGVVSWEEAKHTTDPSKQFTKSTLDLAFETFLRGRKK